jgi:signal transduction histidine kinase
MLDNVEDLLELSRIGRVEHETGPVDVSHVVRGLIEEHHAEINRLGLTVAVDDLPTIVGDRVRLQQIFDNLLVNALKYGCVGDDPQLHFGAEESADEVCFFVRDNGPGIAPEYREKIFALFQRLSSDDDGTGIGLTIVKRCAEIHGGRVWVDSAPGEGATFRIVLPRKPLASDGSARHDELVEETEITT